MRIYVSYSQKLLDPKWQAVRSQVLERDGHRCVKNPNHRMPLEVHHRQYGRGKEPWEYPLSNFLTLCRDCHVAEHRQRLTAERPRRVRGGFYGWHQIGAVVGHEPHGYLTEVHGAIVCGCFVLDLNPDAPDIVLPGTRKDWIKKAHLFADQQTAIPIFLKGEGLPWEYVGDYAVESMTQNQAEIAIHQQRSGHEDIGMVLFLSRS